MFDEVLTGRFSVRLVGAFVNWSLSLLFIYLCIRGRREPLTTSQRWALTLLAWLFILNSINIILEFFLEWFMRQNDWMIFYKLERIRHCTDVMVAMFLIMFGLVYPRPIMKWRRLRPVLLSLFGLVFLLVVFQVYVHLTPALAASTSYRMSNFTYVLGWMLPAILWLPHIERESSPQVRMVMVLFLWGFLVAAYPGTMNHIFGAYRSDVPLTLYNALVIALFLYVNARMAYGLYLRRGAWAAPERVLLLFLVIWLFLGSYRSIRSNDLLSTPGNVIEYWWVIFFTGNLTWVYLRPALFTYALLRYQALGPTLRIERPLILMLGTTLALASFATVEGILINLGSNLETAVAAGAIAGVILFYPLWRVSERMIARILPLVVEEERKSMVERRDTYLMGLQTAVVEGEIDLEEDADALQEQRKMLRISKREHELLLASYEAREKPVSPKEAVEEMFLIHLDGRLIAHVGKSKEKRASDADRDIVAGMLVAIKDYVQEGLTRQKTSLDSIKYGDYSLIIETEETLVLAAVVKGMGTPELRQRMRDEIVQLRKMFGKTLTEWDGDADKVKGVRAYLVEFVGEK